MAQVEKQMKKLKHSVLKKMNSFGKVQGSGRVSSTSGSTSAPASDDADADAGPSPSMVRVWVGKSRREYCVRSQVVDHPAFQNLIVSRSSDGSGVTVGCEVVLFQHLLWMLENDAHSYSPSASPDFLDELLAFYT